MSKIGSIAIVVGFVGLVYMLMMLFQPAILAMIETTNSTVNWEAHSSFSYAQAALTGWPFWSYIIPVSIGTIAVVGILKSG